jgi:hypothetical protein
MRGSHSQDGGLTLTDGSGLSNGHAALPKGAERNEFSGTIEGIRAVPEIDKSVLTLRIKSLFVEQ